VVAQGHGARRQTLGQRGEKVAAEYVEQQLGCTVLARNWRCREGELDIVAYDGEHVVVCEVKTRSGLGFGEPAEAITRDKMIRIKRLARKWLSEYRVPPNRSVRFDVIGVLIPPGGRPLVQHIPGAFE
jgi:putative endonuclease